MTPLAATLLATWLVTAAAPPSIAVLPVRTHTLPANKTAVLDTLLVAGVADLRAYRVIGSGDINAMLGLDKMKAAVGCDDLSCAADIGGATPDPDPHRVSGTERAPAQHRREGGAQRRYVQCGL